MMHELHSENYSDTKYIYVFIRTDIPVANQMVQVGHVCYDAGKKFQAEPETHLILLSVKDQDELIETREYLESNGISTEIFYEPDYNMGYTAVCSQPVSGAEQRYYFYKYNLWHPNKGLSLKTALKRIFKI